MKLTNTFVRRHLAATGDSLRLLRGRRLVVRVLRLVRRLLLRRDADLMSVLLVVRL